jgi:hypothetical protein
MPIPKNLPNLSRLNAFNALARNAQILHIPVECLESDDDNSPLFGWALILKSPSLRPPLALLLQPFNEQSSITHGWICSHFQI